MQPNERETGSQTSRTKYYKQTHWKERGLKITFQPRPLRVMFYRKASETVGLLKVTKQ